jgi:hypothetical protein
MITRTEQSFDLLDHLALWGLTQFRIRPDQSTPTARLQVVFLYQNQTYYFDFFSENNQDQYPYLFGIEWILKKFGKKKKLEDYARILTSSFQQKIKIGKDFETFLFKNKNKIRQDTTLAPYFFRGSEVLKEDESAPSLDYNEIVKIYRKVEKDQKITINNSLFPFNTEIGGKGECNYDFNLYNNSIFLIDKIIPMSNLFGFSSKNETFLATSSQNLTNIASFKGLPLFQGSSKVRSSAVCIIQKPDNQIWTFSNQSRDPGQHLFHMIRYGLAETNSTQELDKLLRHSRHLFLSDPMRLIIESQRSTSGQIENLLKLNIPIYSAERLGNIWSFSNFNQINRFIIDDRNPGAFSCKE